MTDSLWFILFVGFIFMVFELGMWNQRIRDKRNNILAERSEPKTDTDPARGKCRVCGQVFDIVDFELGPKPSICYPCWKKKTAGPPDEFDPPVLSSMPLHEFIPLANSKTTNICGVCGGGRYNAVHANRTERNKELWERIQRGEGAQKP